MKSDSASSPSKTAPKGRSARKQETRERILRSAAARFRSQGFAATGVDALMEGAGLTAGGFYAHFESKEELLGEALKVALTEGRGLLSAGSEGMAPEERLQRYLRRYLSTEHRDHPEMGCPLPSVSGELARSTPAVRETVATYLQKLAETAQDGLSALPVAEREAEALRLIAQAVGALLLSRITKGFAISDAFLKAGRRADPKR